MDTPALLALILLTPLAAAAAIWLVGRRHGAFATLLSVGAAGVVCLAVLHLLFRSWDGTPVTVTVDWLQLGGLRIALGFHLDRVAGLMLLVVGFVGFCIHVFSIGYMADDPARARFFGGMSLFMFSMLGIVLAENLFMLFIFWELVGFSSYVLIGHYLTLPAAAPAAKKAFIVNRVGDFGFLLGIILVWWTFGTTSLPGLAAALELDDSRLLLSGAIGLLLFCGVLGKSAQMPLHVWLPDAMAGPTPVSALIHAATMVAAGVFFLARTVFLFTPEALQVITWIGVATALCAAVWAFAQNDIKRILAYSTLSQLGFMVAAFGLGTSYGLSGAGGPTAVYYGVGAAMFHLTTHAFFKALLFLGSGSVIHACHHEQDIFRMGGLWRRMPVTFVSFLAGVVAIAGVPFIGAGFFSKDAILILAKAQSPLVFGLLVGAALLTAMYMGRLLWVAFLGQPRSEAAAHARETSWLMWLPLLALATCSVVGGYTRFYPPVLRPLLETWVPHVTGSAHTLLIAISALLSLGGLALALLIWGGGADHFQTGLRPLWALCRSRFWFDEIYDAWVARVQQRVADILAFLDTLLIGGLCVRGGAGLAGLFGLLARRAHTGNLQTYAWWFFAGLLLFWAHAAGLLNHLFKS
jgi:NADH-quinone oxidoreductase subunit L